MATLHTVNKSPFERNALDTCLRLAKQGSGILFLEDGVYGALKGTAASEKVAKAAGEHKVYVLGPDLAARGMQEDQILDGIQVVDYAGFVDLAAEHDRVNAWL
ncbi:MAG: sulfurtransferase complex subunit TusB [Gammaproteobacteria bacterium]|nr:sulfurtransferase complex subunit TusB [Gammaproteobacteria bacterium]